MCGIDFYSYSVLLSGVKYPPAGFTVLWVIEHGIGIFQEFLSLSMRSVGILEYEISFTDLLMWGLGHTYEEHIFLEILHLPKHKLPALFEHGIYEK